MLCRSRGWRMARSRSRQSDVGTIDGEHYIGDADANEGKHRCDRSVVVVVVLVMGPFRGGSLSAPLAAGLFQGGLGCAGG